MVVTRLTGGLGNQMFQYAAARALALRNGTELKIDTHFYARQHLRRYELHVYPVSCSFVTDDELFRFGIRNAKKRRFYHSFVYRNWKVVKERHFHFDPTIKLLNSPVYLAGYWQSERYFHEVADILRTEFCPSNSLEPHNARIAADIEAVNAVSVHVRQGLRHSHNRCPNPDGTWNSASDGTTASAGTSTQAPLDGSTTCPW